MYKLGHLSESKELENDLDIVHALSHVRLLGAISVEASDAPQHCSWFFGNPSNGWSPGRKIVQLSLLLRSIDIIARMISDL